MKAGIAQTEEKMTARQITIRNQSVKINYYQKGNGNTTLLFLHGWCINGIYWENQINCFSTNFNVYAIDLPGFGMSTAERENWTIEEYANDVSAFIKEMNLDNVILIGHSMAGEIILQLALSNNPKIVGIVGIDNFKLIDVEFTPQQKQEMEAFFPLLKNDFVNSAPAYADMMLFHPSTTNGVKDRVKTDFAQSNPVIGYETCMNQMLYATTDAQRLEQLSHKLYLLNSNATPTNITGLKNHCKSNFQIEYIPSTGHYPMIEKPKEFNLILTKILKDIN